jgi:hypothetical protein
MSLSQRKDVLQLVEKYRKKYPTLDRNFVRKLIRLENPELFGKNCRSKDTNLKALDRHLRKSFEKDKVSINSENKPNFGCEPRVMDVDMLKLTQELQALEELVPTIKNDERIKIIKKMLRKLSGLE